LFARAEITTDLNRSEVESQIEKELAKSLERVENPERQQELRAYTKPTVTEVTMLSRTFDFRPFAESIIRFKESISKYTNVKFSRAPATIAIVQMSNGFAEAKIDVRTDSKLLADWESLVKTAFPFSTEPVSRWNDPGLYQTDIDENEYYRRFVSIAGETMGWETHIGTGWTEAATLRYERHIPSIVAGPGNPSFAHKMMSIFHFQI